MLSNTAGPAGPQEPTPTELLDSCGPLDSSDCQAFGASVLRVISGCRIKRTLGTGTCGVVYLVYQLFTGELPFAGNSVTARAFAICTEKPWSPRRFDPQFQIFLENNLARLMKKDAKERYQSGNEAAEDIACFVRGAPRVTAAVQALTLTIGTARQVTV